MAFVEVSLLSSSSSTFKDYLLVSFNAFIVDFFKMDSNFAVILFFKCFLYFFATFLLLTICIILADFERLLKNTLFCMFFNFLFLSMAANSSEGISLTHSSSYFTTFAF